MGRVRAGRAGAARPGAAFPAARRALYGLAGRLPAEPKAALPRLVEIQVLRAVAALMVAAHHALHEAGGVALRAGTTAPVPSPVWAAGVDLFFVISGFVMVHASRDLFGTTGAARVFLARRVARVVPLYWLVTAVYLGIALAAPAVLNGDVLDPVFVAASFAFWPMARPDGLVQPLYSLGWTLNYEMWFYALFALAVALPRARAVAAAALALAASVVLGRLVALPQPLAFWAEPIVLEFAFGLGLGLARAHGLVLPAGIRLALAAAGAAGLVWVGTAMPDLPRFVAFGIPGAILVAAAGLGPARAGGASMPARWGERLGDASYALYLVHPFAVRGLRVGLGGLAHLVGAWGFVALALAAALAASLAVHRWIERPLTGAARRALRA
jgi:peptidoglycan/LPS O-acetylase OafA/YrhL